MRPGFEADKSWLVIQYLNQNWHLLISTAENCLCVALLLLLLAAPSRMSIPWQPVAHLSLPFRQLLLGSEGQGRRDVPKISGTTSGSRQALDGIGVFACSNEPPLWPSPTCPPNLCGAAGTSWQGIADGQSTVPVHAVLPGTRASRQMDSNYFNIIF